jgi:hypothetical protein
MEPYVSCTDLTREQRVWRVASRRTKEGRNRIYCQRDSYYIEFARLYRVLKPSHPACYLTKTFASPYLLLTTSTGTLPENERNKRTVEVQSIYRDIRHQTSGFVISLNNHCPP